MANTHKTWNSFLTLLFTIINLFVLDVNLIAAQNKYCGEPSAEACDICIIQNNTFDNVKLNNLYHELGSVTQWRNYYGKKN